MLHNKTDNIYAGEWASACKQFRVVGRDQSLLAAAPQRRADGSAIRPYHLAFESREADIDDENRMKKIALLSLARARKPLGWDVTWRNNFPLQPTCSRERMTFSSES